MPSDTYYKTAWNFAYFSALVLFALAVVADFAKIAFPFVFLMIIPLAALVVGVASFVKYVRSVKALTLSQRPFR